MAFDWSKLNVIEMFNKLDARARVFVLFGGLVGVGILVYILTVALSSESATVGPSRAAKAPRGLQSIPGGKLTPEYQRALQQANQQAASRAQMSGSSAVPTLIGVQTRATQGTGDCTVLCSDDAVDVADTMDTWVKQGKLAPETAKYLNGLAKKNVSIAEYAAELDRLVREGKLTPEQARKLLEQYKKQHTSANMKESAKTMDALIKAGKLSIEDANKLLDAQKRKISPDEYAAMLQRLVREGKLDPATAQRLLNEYIQQRAKEVIAGSIASLRKMTAQGQLTNDVLNELIPLEEQMVPISQYEGKLTELVNAGRLTPVVAGKILDEFKWQKKQIGTTSSVDSMLKASEDAAYQELRELLTEGKITKETASTLGSLIKDDVSFKEFEGVVTQMVQDGRLTPEISQLKLADYRSVKGFRDLSDKLQGLSDGNATESEYEAALREAVANGTLSPEQAAQLLKEYQENKNRMSAAATATLPTIEGTGEFAKLQQRLQSSSAAQPSSDISEQASESFSAAQLQSQQEMLAARQERITAMATAMTNQAQQLIASWQPPKMTHQEGTPAKDDKDKEGGNGAGNGSGTAANGQQGDGEQIDNAKPVLVKAGEILFAVLDTAVNSDYPDSPVMATIVQGKFKGAKLLGRLVTTKGVSGQMDRVTLNFQVMNVPHWPKSKTVTAFAIDPDTARTVIASSVNYHYMMRFGAIMATSFIEGYANAIQSSGGTTTTGIFGTSSTNPELSPAQKLASAIGAIGTALSDVTKKYTERPPTVRVNAGVGLGILFMQDLQDDTG